MTEEVLIVGAGPAGAVAALVLARAGVRVRLVDRASFPRDTLCGDTINPGTLAMLRRLKVAGAIERCSLRVDGMLVTGEGSVAIKGRYPEGLHGQAVIRRTLDWILLQAAIQAGARFDAGVPVRGAIVGERRGVALVEGVRAGSNGASKSIRAHVTIAADGRHSTLAFGLGLARHPARPRRWAIGGYFENATGTSTLGEMHIRSGRYIGVAPLAGGIVNVCLVEAPASGSVRDPGAVLRAALATDGVLRGRFAAARLVGPPSVRGPLAVESVGGAGTEPEGLVLAGDAAGFIDPMTGDGLRFAVRGGELAAAACLEALEHGWTGVHARLAATRRREFASKWRFNRALRRLVGSATAVRAAAAGARIAPGLVRAIIGRAGDCDVVLTGAGDPTPSAN